MKEVDCIAKFRGEARQAVGGGEGVLDDWATTAEVRREIAMKVLGVNSGQGEENRET